MTIYKVEQNRLSYDYGHVIGTVVVGYYSTKEKAEKAKEEAEKKDKIIWGNVYIEKIEVE